jgi:hypothetical protein
MVAALIFDFKKDALEDQGGILEIHAVIFKVTWSFWFIPLEPRSP